jgi:hypothetical protein
MSLNMVTSNMGIKYDSQYLKPNIINKVDGISNVLGNKI